MFVDICGELEDKRLELQGLFHTTLAIIDENNWFQVTEELKSLEAKMEMIDDIIYFIENRKWYTA